ncbi:MAG: VCBS repeat-containing protein, partial [Sphingobacteriaceae bacterium]
MLFKKYLTVFIACFSVFQVEAQVLFNHHTYQDFIKGKLSDSGGNLYISKNGKIQFVNLFDLNADGYPEVVVNNDHNGYDTPDAMVYRNTVSGLRSLTFPFAQDAAAFQSFDYTMESLKNITRLPAAGGGKAVIADINQDGYKDLVFANIIHGSTLLEMPSYIYWGGADGFNPLRRSLLPGDRAVGVAVGDVTGDGLPDIVVANVGREHMYSETADYSYATLGKRAGDREKTSYLYKQTEPGFAPDARTTIATQFAVDVKIADFKNNGQKSLVFLELGQPGGLRIIPIENDKPGKPQILPVLNIRFSPSWGKRLAPELLVKDLNNDGFVDIFVPSTGNKSEIFWSNKGTFSANNKTVLTAENAFAAEAADLNKDGFTDLVIADFYSFDGQDNKYSKDNYNFETNSYIWWGSKTGFSNAQKTALPTLGAVNVKLADVNHTGFTDILFAQHRNNQTVDVNSVVYYNQNGKFYIENRTDLKSFGAADILAEDLSGTGRKDVILINGLSGTARHAGLNDGPGNEGVTAAGLPMYIYKGNAAGKYGTENLIRVPEASQETNIAFADMEDKGHADLVYMRSNGYRVAIRYNIYNYPQEKEITEVEVPFRGNTVNVADFNKDGVLDILVTPISGGKGALLFGLGNRKYKTELFDFDNMAYSAAVGDVNNDGLLDAVTCGYSQLCILLGSNTGGSYHLQKPVVLKTPDFITRVCLADFNNDGWLDILSQQFQNFDTKSYNIQSCVLVNNKGSFSYNNKRSFHTFGANGGSVAQVYGDGKMQFINTNYHADESRR